MFAEVLGVEDLYYTSATHVLYLCVCGGVVFLFGYQDIYTNRDVFDHTRIMFGIPKP